jgi:acid stress-induced BolA-like protein IbaG/YrbA
MLTAAKLKQTLEAALPGVMAEFHDLTGTSDHWQVVAVGPVFEGKPLIAQHRMVQGVFEDQIQSGELHALTIRTFTPAQWAQQKK